MPVRVGSVRCQALARPDTNRPAGLLANEAVNRGDTRLLARTFANTPDRARASP